LFIIRDAPDIRPFFIGIRYPAVYGICLAGYLAVYRIMKIAGYQAKGNITIRDEPDTDIPVLVSGRLDIQPAVYQAGRISGQSKKSDTGYPAGY
jgi:hypothetical protein